MVTSGRSILVLSRHPERRRVAAYAFRGDGAVVVEVATVHHADTILRQLRFDVLAVDFFGLGVGVFQLLHDLDVDYPDTCVSVIGPPVDSDVVARFHRSHLLHRPAACSAQRLGAGDAKHHFERGSNPADGLDRVWGEGRQEQTDVQEGE